ncbi:MAG: DUF1566 domain-containing protein [Nitrospinae bacterium]|nr:DUF1566 domain-containing protein [Nitrospinota bacterium]MBL7021054.1 DUF1566 domain-containing protein [Nitrospinaceae bacterium]
MATSISSYADEKFSCTPRPPYEASHYVEPLLEPGISKLHLIDNEDGSIVDSDSGLLWTKKDSYADLGKCLTWQESLDYVEKLDTAGFADWRMPTIKELATLYDPTKENNMAWDHNPEYPLALDEKFADGAAYWFWSNDGVIVEQKRGCARTLYFVNGLTHLRNLGQCNNGGVRAVRKLK